MRTSETEFVFATIFHPSSSWEMMFVRVVPFTFSFQLFIQMIMEIVLSSCGNSGIDICSHRKLSDLEYADDVVLLPEDSSKL